MLSNQPKPGTKREQLIEHLTRQIKHETWGLIRHGDLSRVLYTGDEPGFFALLNAHSVEDTKGLVERESQRLEVSDLDMYPVKQFPHFD